MTTDQTGADLAPALGGGPLVVDAEPVDAAAPRKVSLFPEIPRSVTFARILIGVGALTAALIAPLLAQPFMNQLLAQAVYLAIATMGLNLLTGYNGQVSIGHGAFYGIGAFTSALLVMDYGWTFEVTIPVAMVITFVVGLLIGLPALRVRGLYLALVTLGLAVLFPQVAQKYVKRTGGISLLQPDPRSIGSPFSGLRDDRYAYYLGLAILIVLSFLAWNLVRGRVGRAMIAVRDQEIAATSVGVHTARTKVTTFAISAAYAGAAGSMSLMVDKQAVGADAFLYFQRSIQFLVAMVIGGAATIMGPAVGALVLVILQRNTMDLISGKPILAPAVYGGALIAIIFVLPDGVVGGVNRLLAALGRRSSAKGRPPTRPIPDDSSHD